MVRTTRRAYMMPETDGFVYSADIDCRAVVRVPLGTHHDDRHLPRLAQAEHYRVPGIRLDGEGEGRDGDERERKDRVISDSGL